MESQNLKQEEVKVKWYGYLVLFLGILFFSGLMKDAPGPLKALDFNNVLGSFGKLGTPVSYTHLIQNCTHSFSKTEVMIKERKRI